jgi:hypothetical protein
MVLACEHGFGMGLAWVWHGFGMGLEWFWHVGIGQTIGFLMKLSYSI